MRVRFIQRCGAYFPGADPMLDKDEAARLIANGICVPFVDEPPVIVKPAPVYMEAAPDEPTEVEPEPPAEEAIEPHRKRGRRS